MHTDVLSIFVGIIMRMLFLGREKYI